MQKWVLLLLPATAEGSGCAVMVGAGVMVGVVAATMAEGEVEGAATCKKRERKNIIRLYGMYVQFIILFYVISK